MADEHYTKILRTALVEFDTPHLQKLIVAAYDRWTWDTGSDADKEWFEIAEEILEERGVSVVINNPTANTNITFQMGTNGPTIPVLTLDQNTDLTLGTGKILKIVDAKKCGAIEHEIFEVDGSNLELGWHLKQLLVDFLTNELEQICTMNSNGKYLKQVVAEKAVEAVQEALK